MSYLVGGLLSLVSVLSAYIYWQKKSAISEADRIKKLQDDILKKQQDTLIVFDKNISEVLSREFNDHDEVASYLSGKPINRN